MNTIYVEICCGDCCYNRGAAKILDLEDDLSDDCRGRVEIKATDHCLHLCEMAGLDQAPIVRFNSGEVMYGATRERVLARICELTASIP